MGNLLVLARWRSESVGDPIDEITAENLDWRDRKLDGSELARC
jgi:hypothetical protein